MTAPSLATFCNGFPAIVEGCVGTAGKIAAVFDRHASPSGPFGPVDCPLCPPITPWGTNQPHFAPGFLVAFAKHFCQLCKTLAALLLRPLFYLANTPAERASHFTGILHHPYTLRTQMRRAALKRRIKSVPRLIPLRGVFCSFLLFHSSASVIPKRSRRV